MEFRDVALKKVRADTNVKRKIVSYKKEMSEKASTTKKSFLSFFNIIALLPTEHFQRKCGFVKHSISPFKN